MYVSLLFKADHVFTKNIGMKKIIFVFVFGFQSFALSCEQDLILVLTSAKQAVVKDFSSSEPCYKAAMVGRTQGLPGCYPPKALQLQSLLLPYLQRAKQVCQSVCQREGLEGSCLRFIDQNHLRDNGIVPLLQDLKSGGLFSRSKDDIFL